MHKETNYSKLYDVNKNERLSDDGLSIYAVRKKIETLTANEIQNIVDPAIKETIINFLKNKGVDISKSNKIPANAFSETIFAPSKKSKIKVPIKRVRIAVPSSNMVKLKDYNIWVAPGSNHHIIIYSDEKGKVQFKTVTLFEVARRKANNLPIISKELAPDCDFLLSLQRNEMLMVGPAPEGFDVNTKSTYKLIFDQVYRVQKFDVNGNITLRKHFVSLAQGNMGVLRKIPNSLIKENIQKIIVDPCGFINYE